LKSNAAIGAVLLPSAVFDCRKMRNSHARHQC
jgi:hypothetical protein